jgi:hypothetical protein
MSIDRIAESMGLASKWALYKWIEAASMPARLIRPFETACRCTYITQHLAAGAGKLMIDMPRGRMPAAGDIQAVQHACHAAVGALLTYAAGKSNPDTTIATVTHAMERLARERAEVERATQPDLELQ